MTVTTAVRTPSSRWRRRGAVLATVALTGGVVTGGVVAWGVVDGVAGAPVRPASFDSGADVLAAAERLPQVGDFVSVFERAELTNPVRDAALAAAWSVGAQAEVGRGFGAPLTRVLRGNTVVQQVSAPGWGFPMAVTALPPVAVLNLSGVEVAAAVSAGQVVMGATSAGLRGAVAGDVLDMMGPYETTVSYTIALVVPDAVVGGTEILMSMSAADRLGNIPPTRVFIYGRFDRAALDAAFTTRGLSNNSTVRIRTSWAPRDPDSTLSLAATKALLGEFDIDYRNLTANGWTSRNATWTAANMPALRYTYPTGIRARCHNVIHADLEAALLEVANTLGFLVNSGSSNTTGIDVPNTNTYGGCGTDQARLSRITQMLGSVSRHSWAQALDMSTVSNCQGCVPRLDCRIVRIFRAHNFAWGGNFLTPDGMHVEWVGEPRDQLPYPSKYCPNQVSLQNRAESSPGVTGTTELFVDDGLVHE